MKTLYVQASKGKQSLDYTEYLEHNGSRYRVVLIRDFYDHQSSGVVSRWDGSKWQDVFSCSPMRLKLGAYPSQAEPLLWQDDAALDAQYMVGMAAMVIGEEAA